MVLMLPALVALAAALPVQTPPPFAARAEALSTAKDWEGLEREARAQLARQPKDPLALRWIAHALLMKGATGDAVPYLEQAIDADPKVPELRVNLALAQALLGNREAFLEALSRAERLRSDLLRVITAAPVVLEKFGSGSGLPIIPAPKAVPGSFTLDTPKNDIWTSSWRGSVVLEVCLDAEGQVTGCTALYGHPSLAQPYARSLMGGRFQTDPKAGPARFALVIQKTQNRAPGR